MEYENKAKDAENRGDFVLAIKFYAQALKSLQEMQLVAGLQFDKGNILLRMANLYTELGDFTNAIKYYEEAINTFLESDEPLTKVYRLVGECYTYIGVCYLADENFKGALRYFQKAVEYSKKAAELEDPVLRKYVIERSIFNLALIILSLMNLGKTKKEILPFIETASMLNKSYNLTGFVTYLLLFLRHILTEKYSEARMIFKDEIEEASGAMLLTSTLHGTVMALIQDLTSKHIPEARVQKQGQIFDEKGEVFFTTKIYEDILIHGLTFANPKMPTSEYKEVYGLIVGKIEGDDIIISEVVPIASGTDVEVIFEEEHYAKSAMVDSLAAERNEFIVGWYHTHPKLGLFLSPTDITNQLGYQTLNPKAIAIVFDFTELTFSNPGLSIFRLDDPTLGQGSYFHKVKWRIKDAPKNLYAESLELYEKFLINLNNLLLKNQKLALSKLAEELNRSELLLAEILPQLISLRYLPGAVFDPNTNILSLRA